MILAGHHTMMGGGAAPMRCAVFNGAYSSVIGANVGTVSPNTAGLSCAFWANAHTVPTNQQKCVSMYDARTYKRTGPQWNIGNSPDGMQMRAIFQYVTGFTFVSTGAQTDEWHHYAFSWSSNSMTYYYDGTSIHTESKATTWLRDGYSANLLMQIGGTITDNNQAIDGRIASVHIFDRAITASEAATLAGSHGATLPAWHQWLFANDDGTDTGTATTKWDLSVGSTTAFEKLSTGGG